MVVARLLRERLTGETGPAAAPNPRDYWAQDQGLHPLKTSGSDPAFLCLRSQNTWMSSQNVLGKKSLKVNDKDGSRDHLTVGFCSRCLRARGAAARPTGRCCAQCPRVRRRSVWTPCTSPTSAALSAKTVCGAHRARGRLHVPHGPRTSSLIPPW